MTNSTQCTSMIRNFPLAISALCLTLIALAGCSSEAPQPDKPVAEAPPAAAAPQPEPKPPQPPEPARKEPVASQAPRSALDLSHLPPNVEFVLLARPAEILNAPLIQGRPGTEQLVAMLNQVGIQQGLSILDLEVVSVGVGGLSERVATKAKGDLAALGPVAARELFANLESIGTFRSKATFDAAALSGNGAEIREHQAKSYIVNPSFVDGSGEPQVAWIAEPNVLVAGPEQFVRRAIERGETKTPQPDLTFVDTTPQVVLVVKPHDRDAWLRQIPFDPETADPSPQGQLAGLLWKHLEALALGIRVSDGLGIEVAFDCRDADGSHAIRQALDVIITQAKSAFTAAKASLPPELAEIGEGFLSSLKFTEENKTLRLAGSTPALSPEKLQAVEMQLFGLIMQLSTPPTNPPSLEPEDAPSNDQ